MILLLLGLAPADLAPGAPQLSEAQARVAHLLVNAQAVGVSVLRLQTAWTGFAKPATPCGNDARLEVGWRIERFGAAWRESVQATLAQARRLDSVRRQPTVSPLIDAAWATTLDGLMADTAAQELAFLQASAWQAAYVRPVLAACPVVEASVQWGIPALHVAVENAPELPVAVLGIGDGFICPERLRAEGGVVLASSGRACWATTVACDCEALPVDPGAILGPEMEGNPLLAPAGPVLPAPDVGVEPDTEVQVIPLDPFPFLDPLPQ